MAFKPAVALLAAAAVLMLGACTEEEIAAYQAANGGGGSGGGTVQPSPTPSPTPNNGSCANAGNPGKMSTTQAVSQAEKCAILKAHNDARAAEHAGIPDLTWSDTLASSAFAYAQKCVWAHSDTGYGENLMMGTAGGYSVTDAVNGWVGERRNYNGQPIGQGNFSAYGHYTQVVWKSTTEVGCGYARCGGNVIMVCQYNPPGNYTGQKPF